MVFHGETDDVGAGQDEERVRLEMLGLLGRTGECDLGTLYRSLIGLLGSEVVAHIGSMLARMIRDGVVEIDARQDGPGAPLIGIARLVGLVRPPYASVQA